MDTHITMESRGTSQKNNFFKKVLNYISNSMEY